MKVTNLEIKTLIDTIKKCYGYDFSDYSINSFTRRVNKILEDNNFDIYTLINKIKVDENFYEHVINEIMVNTTELFRDPEIWQTIRYRILPKIKNKKEINIWHAGCSAGQEVYSMCMILNELGLLEKSNIYATDLSSKIIKQAKKGEYIYKFNIEYLQNFDEVMKNNPYNFEEYTNIPYSKYLKIDKIKNKIAINPELLKIPVFKRHNLISRQNPFSTKYDIIFCRNVLIYFNINLQLRLIDYFYENLENKGFLILGVHESLLGESAMKFNKIGYIYSKKII